MIQKQIKVNDSTLTEMRGVRMGHPEGFWLKCLEVELEI
jgi:hypothetical protein